MRSSKVSELTSTPGAASAHSRLRANTTGAAARPALASACGLPMSADANTSAGSPFSIRSRSSPEAPKVALTAGPPRCVEGLHDLVHGGAQAPCGVQLHARLLAVRNHAHHERNSEREGPHVHTPGCPASG